MAIPTANTRKQHPSLTSDTETKQWIFGCLKSLANDRWIEMVSLQFSFACIVVLAVVLREFDQKWLSQWPFDFSLNTTVSLLATLAKIALMVPVTECISQLKWLWFTRHTKSLIDLETFDAASRGPMGYFTFLVKLPRPNWATVGVITSILAILASPLTQQAVQYPSRDVCTQTAVADTVTNYTPLDHLQFNDEMDTLLTPQLKAALHNGLSTSTVPALSPTCPTANCTFAPFQSLAVCSDVTDLSVLLNITQPDTANDQTCIASIFPCANGYRATDFVFDDTSLMPLKLIKNPLRVGISLVNSTIMADLSKGHCQNIIALQFRLYYCVKEFSTEVINGETRTEDRIVDSRGTQSLVSGSRFVTTTDGQTFIGELPNFNDMFVGDTTQNGLPNDVADTMVNGVPNDATLYVAA